MALEALSFTWFPEGMQTAVSQCILMTVTLGSETMTLQLLGLTGLQVVRSPSKSEKQSGRDGNGRLGRHFCNDAVLAWT